MNKSPAPITTQDAHAAQSAGMARVIKSLEALRLIHLTKGDISIADSLQTDLNFLRPQKRKVSRKAELFNA